ncbi:putative secoisolariciresinol dehydrogenase [Helianthus annuus]|uniref:Secoisolariciresinol dehydrogenase n=1 Tax=Helianthus annuus TaxID=4232 RepID=A0A9K3P5M4_HELAN|nr:putative secoisolariciresinol dehydrogenase [Helianthus annuus]KAJ0612744.1 putative secoisolariciresinol dehydrogenase [Helianthus annuus]KAJ0628111.1 putative secoisolariciresinol dehydrogenase [Helianthus annuus]KAJ0784400.1 putative secoisolariciresinol dehydrogenase [Helianthus annuus]KAJ0949449.1 putative secoisolariciresinol dehydrogenase [Helianthus annuus]
MFCNAGIADPYKARVMDVEKVDFQRVLDVNVLGVFLSMKHAARVMVPARAGSIISTTASLASNIWWCSLTCLMLFKACCSRLDEEFGGRAWTIWHSSQLFYYFISLNIRKLYKLVCHGPVSGKALSNRRLQVARCRSSDIISLEVKS